VGITAGDPHVTVRPEARTMYRWSFAGTWSVDGSVSPTFTVDVVPGQSPTTRARAGR
jgi:hypothetical protein